MTSINSNSVIPLGQPGATPAASGIAPHEAADAVTGGGGAEETGGGTGAYFDADSEYYTTPDYKTVPDRSADVTAGGGATSVAPTLADFSDLGIFTDADLAKISAANLSPAQLTELYASASGTPAPAATTTTRPAAATSAPTVQDFAKLGVFSEADLAKISAANLSPTAAIALYEQTVAHFQSPAGQAELQARAKAIDPVAGGGEVAGPGTTTEVAPTTDVANQPVTEVSQLTTLTPAEQGNFLAALQVATQQLATPEVRAAVKTELAAAGMGTTEQDIDAAIAQIATSYETPAGARELMDRATAEGWFDPAAKPAWNNDWRVKFEKIADAQGVHPGTSTAFAQTIQSYGASEEELTALQAFYSTKEGAAQLKAELGGIEAAVRGGDTLKSAITGGVAVLSVGSLIVAMRARNGMVVKGLQSMAATGTTTQVKTAMTMLSQLGTKTAKSALADISKMNPALKAATSVDDIAKARTASFQYLKSWEHGNIIKRWVIKPSQMVAAPPALTAGNVAKRAGGALLGQFQNSSDDLLKGAAKAGTGAAVTGGGAATAKAAGGGLLKGMAPKIGGGILAAGFAAWQIHDIVKMSEAEGGFGKESQKMTGSAVGGTVGGAVGFALGSVLPGVGNIALSAAMATAGADIGETVVGTVQDAADGKGWTRNTSKLAGGAVGGALAGAAVGALAGSVVPVVGTVIGAAVGGVIGWFAGSAAGGAIHDAAAGEANITKPKPAEAAGGSEAKY